MISILIIEIAPQLNLNLFNLVFFLLSLIGIAIAFQADTASIIAIGATADLISRIFLAITAIFIQVPARYIYLGGALFTVFVRFGEH